jgi:type IV secretory pathway VirJ component
VASALILAVSSAGSTPGAASDPPGAAPAEPKAPAPAAPDGAAPPAAAPARPPHRNQEAKLGNLSLKMGQKRLIYIYEPAAGADPNAQAVLYFSGDWGWRPLQQETATYLADRGRFVVGIDAPEYFSDQLGPDDWTADLATLRAYVNEKARKPPGTPVLLVGFTFGGALVPYILNRGGTNGFSGALLISLAREGAIVYSTSIQLKLPLPPDEVFNVGQEIHHLPASFPIFLMDAVGDAESAMKDLLGLVRGPKRSVSVEGSDRSFRLARDAHFAEVGKALAWLQGAQQEAGVAPPTAGPRPPVPHGRF